MLLSTTSSSCLQQEWFWQMIQTFVVFVSLVLIIWQIRIQTASHVVQTLTTIHNRWNEETMLRARLKVCTDWLQSTNEFDGVDEYVSEFMEELGNYLQMKAIPKRAMWESQSWYIEHYYCIFREGIEKAREFHHDPNLYTRFENLYYIMNKINKCAGSPAVTRGSEDLKRFALSETQAATAFLKLQEPTPSGPRRRNAKQETSNQ